MEEVIIKNVLEQSDALSYCQHCSHWNGVKLPHATRSYCRHCGVRQVLVGSHKQWARWYNPLRGYAYIPNIPAIKIPSDSRAFRVLNAIRNKYVAA